MKFRKSHREEVPVSMDDTAPSAPEGAAPAAPGPNDAPADPAAPRYKFPTWFDLLALVGLFVVIQLVVAFVLLLAGARMPDAAALGSADETVAARAHAAAAQFNFMFIRQEPVFRQCCKRPCRTAAFPIGAQVQINLIRMPWKLEFLPEHFAFSAEIPDLLSFFIKKSACE